MGPSSRHDVSIEDRSPSLLALVTDLSRWSADDLEAVALAINDRPRKTLGWRTPAEVLDEQLRSLQQPGVATTP